MISDHKGWKLRGSTFPISFKPIVFNTSYTDFTNRKLTSCPLRASPSPYRSESLEPNSPKSSRTFAIGRKTWKAWTCRLRLCSECTLAPRCGLRIWPFPVWPSPFPCGCPPASRPWPTRRVDRPPEPPLIFDGTFLLRWRRSWTFCCVRRTRIRFLSWWFLKKKFWFSTVLRIVIYWAITSFQSSSDYGSSSRNGIHTFDWQ